MVLAAKMRRISITICRIIYESTHRVDITPWLEWFLGCLNHSLEQTEQTISMILARARFWKNNNGQEFNLRQQKMLHVLLDNFFGKLNVSKWATMNKTLQILQ